MLYFVFICWLFKCKRSWIITSVGEERANLSAVVLVIMWFLIGKVSSSFGCLGWATLFYCDTP